MRNIYMLNNHLMKACLAAVFAIGLTACSSSSDNGSSSDSGDTAMMPEPMPEPEPTAIDLPEDHGFDIEDGKPQSFELAAGASERYADTVFSCPADGDSCTITVTSTLGRVSATSTGGMATAAMYMPPPTEFNAAQTRELAGLLVAPSSTALPTGIGKRTNQLDVAYGQEPMIKVGAGQAEFTAADAPPAIDDWAANALERTNDDASMDRVIVYSNAMAPDGDTFERTYGVHAGNSDDVSPGDPEVTSELFWSKVEGPAAYIPAKSDPGLDNPPSITITVPASGSVTFMGTFDGVSGMFSCAGDADDTCVIARTGDMLSLDTSGSDNGAFSFKADDAKAMVKGDAADFTAFGWWIQTPADGGALTTFRPYALATSDAVTAGDGTSNLRNLVGGAKYEGSAAGRYVMREAGDETAHSGVFTANAELTAQFGAEALIRGTVEGFRDSDGESLGLRQLTLQEIDLSAASTSSIDTDDDGVLDGPFTTGATAFTGQTMVSMRGAGRAADGEGSWSVSFHDQTGTQQPSTVIGTFGAEAGALAPGTDDHGFVAVGGAFSASK